MPDRRQFLTAAGLGVAAATLAACGTPDHPLPATGAATMTLGSVTNPTGNVSGKDLTHLVDAYAGSWSGLLQPQGTAMAQWNYVGPLMSNTSGACDREGTTGSYAPNEITLSITIVGYADLPNPAPVAPPAADLPLTLPIGQVHTTSDGVRRIADGHVMQATKTGKAGNDTKTTGGTVTFTRLDSQAHEGSYDLLFGTSRVTGSFVAPWCGTWPT